MLRAAYNEGRQSMAIKQRGSTPCRIARLRFVRLRKASFLAITRVAPLRIQEFILPPSFPVQEKGNDKRVADAGQNGDRSREGTLPILEDAGYLTVQDTITQISADVAWAGSADRVLVRLRGIA